MPGLRQRLALDATLQVAALVVLTGLVAWSAILTKQAARRGAIPALAELGANSARPAPAPRTDPAPPAESQPVAVLARTHAVSRALALSALGGVVTDASAGGTSAPSAEPAAPRGTQAPGVRSGDLSIRYFGGRPVRPARTLWMTVTAYSPDARSCGASADGITASLHSVQTNAGRLVAADSAILPLGSILSIPGYSGEQIVPVLDRGGAIKGHRLDVLFPTHEQARQFGRRRVKVTVWEYADGKPPPDWRRLRDSKN